MPKTKAEKAAYDRIYRERNKETIAAKKRAYAAANAAREQARVKAWVEANRERSREIKDAWKARNPEADRVAGMSEERAEKKREYMRAYTKANPHVFARNNTRRRKNVAHATPSWADMPAIRELYEQAHVQGLHIDHEIPLRGKNVCGLHVENNLRPLEPRLNRIKGNSYAD